MFSYHNHSDFSDGHVSPEEQIVSAYNLGLKEFGLSDHFCIWQDGNASEEAIKDIDKYFKTLEALKEKYSDKIFVKMGVEFENLPKMNEKQSSVLKNYPLDYIIGGTHYIDDWPMDYSKESWLELGADEIDRRIIKYWELVYDLCKYGDIDIVAHFALYEKWGQLINKDYIEYFAECLKVCKDRGLVVEINTAKKIAPLEFYPRESYIELMADYDIPVIISGDAHYPIHILRYFDEAKKLLIKYKIKRTARFDKRKILIEEINFE